MSKGNPNHDEHGRFSSNATHGTGPDKDSTVKHYAANHPSLKINMTFDQVKGLVAHRERELTEASSKLKSVDGVGKGSMGLTPDKVKNSQQYKDAKATVDKAFSNLRNANKHINKNFAKELKAERKAKGR